MRAGIALVAVIGGCAATMDAGRGRLLETGAIQSGGGVSLSSVGAPLSTEAPTHLPWLTPSVHLRAGVHERVEVGATAWAFGWPDVFTTVGGSIQALTPVGPRERRRPSSTGLRLTWHRLGWGGAGHHVLGAEVPYNIDFRAGDQAWTLSPRVGLWSAWGRGQAPILHPALGLGAALRWQATERLLVSPAVSFGWAPVPFDGAAGDPDHRGLSTFEIGATFLRTRPERRR